MPRTASHSSSKPNNRPPVVIQNPSSSVVQHTLPEPPTFGQTLKQGLAFGTGSAIAHRIFNPFPQVIQASPEQKKEFSCYKELIAFENCMKTKTSDDYCGVEQMSYTQCLRLERNNTTQ